MKPQNLLFILSDEHNPYALGCAGHAFVKTPNLDRLSEHGTRFSTAYSNSPLCVPARASLATGRYVHDIGYWDNAIAYDGRVESWGHVLQRTDHRVESIGKLHYRAEKDPTGFDRQINPVHIAGGIGQVWGSVREPPPETPDKAAKMLLPIGAGFSNYNAYDQKNAQLACAWLAEAAKTMHDKPWVLFVGLVAPHFPLTVPQDFLDLYPLDTLPEPRLHPRSGYQRHPWVEQFHRCQPVDDSMNDDTRRLATASYYGLCSYVDHQVGRILDALEHSGLTDSTRVIYSSDHGDNLGVRGLWGKCTLYEESAGIPLIIAGADIPRGKVCATPASLVDCYQTILHGVGAEPPPNDRHRPGQSLFELAAAADNPERTAFSEYHAVGSASGAFMLRKGRYKFNYYVGHDPELFDLVNDPGETCNVAANLPDIVQDYEVLLRDIVDPEAVDRQAKADQAELIERFGGREQALTLGTQGATPVPNANTASVV